MGPIFNDVDVRQTAQLVVLEAFIFEDRIKNSHTTFARIGEFVNCY